MQTRYCSIGFNDAAHLDEGTLWATTFAITAWNKSNEEALRALVGQATD